MNTIKRMSVLVIVLSLGLCATRPLLGAGAFSQSGPLGSGTLDASVGLTPSKTYTHAYNIAGGSGTTNINGVTFINVPAGNYTGVPDSFSMAGWNANLTGGDVIGGGVGLGFLLSSFNYYNNPPKFPQETLTLHNLVPGTFYILTFYNKTWGVVGEFPQLLTSSGGAEAVTDQSVGSRPNASVLRYTFMATDTDEWVRFGALNVQVPRSYHLYAFSTEVLALTNTWTGGDGSWSAPNWSAGVPNGQNAQAVFPSQENPTVIQLDMPATIGHLQMDGANAYTLEGTEPLTVLTDVGGAGVFNVKTGSHLIAVSTVLSNDMVKLGEGTLTMSGAIAGPGKVNVSEGVFKLGAPEAAPAGTVAVNGGTYDLGGFSVSNGMVTMGSGAISNGTLTDMACLFSGGAVYANLAGTGALTNTTGTTTLYNTNTYSGGTVINSGTLAITNTVSLPGWDTAGRVTVASGGTLSVGNEVTDGDIETMLGTGNFLSGANIAFDTSDGDRTYGVLTNAGILGLQKFGNNTLTLDPATVSGGLKVRQGTLALASGVITNTTLDDYVGDQTGDSAALLLQGSSRYVKTPEVSQNYVVLGNQPGSSGTLSISDSALFQTPSLFVGNYGSGALYQTGGTSVQTARSGIEELMIGRRAGGYGFYSLSGGIQSNALQNLSIGYNGIGLYYQSGTGIQMDGAGTTTGTFQITRGAGGTGVLYVANGLLNRSNTSAYYGWDAGACRGEWTMAGGTASVYRIRFGHRDASGNIGMLNLNGGVLQLRYIEQGQAAALANVNFNGGLLQARQSSTAFLELKGNSGAYVYPGGAVIDDNGFNVNIAQGLLAPTGSGVSGVPPFEPIGGYIGAPYVEISGGGGTGATAVALFDQATSNVTGVVVTSRGVNYTSAPTVTLLGGGTTNYVLGTATLEANASGGLTKLGSGAVKLSGRNTYTGATTVSNGTLRIGQAGALPKDAEVVVAGGTYDLGGYVVTNGTVTLHDGTIANGWLEAASVTVSETNAAITASLAGDARKTGDGTLTLRGAQSGLSGLTVAEGTLTLAHLNAPPPGVVACYRFDGTTEDATGNGHNGTFEGTGHSFVPGRSVSAGQAINFTGNNSVTVPYKADLALSDFTVSAWVNANITPPNDTEGFGILSTRFGGDFTFDFKVRRTQTHGDIGNGTAWLHTSLTSPVATLPNEWHMVTYAIDNGAQNVRIYYDGVLVKTIPFNGTPLLMKPGQTLKIGSSYKTKEYMNGKIDDLFVFNHALSSEQVAQLYHEGVTPPTGILPVTLPVTVDAGATLNLDGHAQEIAALGGNGIVSNGTLTVTGVTMPGGTNAIGTLTLAADTTLSGTLLIDVAADGACDALQMEGALNLVNLDLQVQDPGQIGLGKEYVIARFTPGTLTGRFVSSNIDNRRSISYNNAAGEIRLVGRGSVISFF